MMDETSEKFIGGKIVRGESPLNLEMPFEILDAFLTPTKSFYVRTHFPIPAIDRDAWWLHVEGNVENPFAINYEQLLEVESVTVPVTLECAGNSRSFLQPKVKGVQSARQNGLACFCRHCLIARLSGRRRARSSSKERTAACSTIQKARLAS